MSLQGLEHGSIGWTELVYDRERCWALSNAA